MAVVGAIELPKNETGEELDPKGLTALVDEIRSWPDTSLAGAIFTQDSEGRPRWVVRTDWPLDDLIKRIRSLLSQPALQKILANVELRQRDDDTFVIELADTALAVLRPTTDGSSVASSATVELPAKLYGRRVTAKSAESDAKTLVFCRISLGGSDDDGRSSFLSSIIGIRSLRYACGLTSSGDWVERIGLSWNPMLGLVIKGSVKRVKKQFDCPAGALAVAAFHLDTGGGLADSIADLPSGTTGPVTSGEVAIALVPGTGFFPIPDVFYQFAVSRREKAIAAIRKFIAEDTEARAEDDREPEWREMSVGGSPVFWRDPTADGGGAVSFANFRTVVFFEPGDPDRKTEDRMIIAETTSFAEAAVEQWRKMRRLKAIRLPDGADAHWQARISWKRIYALIEPYAGLMTAFGEDTKPLPSAEMLGAALSDSIISVRIETTGLRVTQTGPIPVGMVLVPSVVAEALGARGDASSEAERERLACRHLRVLYHHAKLFKKDYGRWPATVAELDGYVDFNEHRELLWIPEQKRGLVAGLVSTAIGGRRYPEVDRDKVDDALYEIDWTPDRWALRFRDGEFRDYKTISIDAAGQIHRIPKASSDKKVAADGD